MSRIALGDSGTTKSKGITSIVVRPVTQDPRLLRGVRSRANSGSTMESVSEGEDNKIQLGGDCHKFNLTSQKLSGLSGMQSAEKCSKWLKDQVLECMVEHAPWVTGQELHQSPAKIETNQRIVQSSKVTIGAHVIDSNNNMENLTQSQQGRSDSIQNVSSSRDMLEILNNATMRTKDSLESSGRKGRSRLSTEKDQSERDMNTKTSSIASESPQEDASELNSTDVPLSSAQQSLPPLHASISSCTNRQEPSDYLLSPVKITNREEPSDCLLSPVKSEESYLMTVQKIVHCAEEVLHSDMSECDLDVKNTKSVKKRLSMEDEDGCSEQCGVVKKEVSEDFPTSLASADVVDEKKTNAHEIDVKPDVRTINNENTVLKKTGCYVLGTYIKEEPTDVVDVKPVVMSVEEPSAVCEKQQMNRGLSVKETGNDSKSPADEQVGNIELHKDTHKPAESNTGVEEKSPNDDIWGTLQPKNNLKNLPRTDEVDSFSAENVIHKSLPQTSNTNVMTLVTTDSLEETNESQTGDHGNNSSCKEVELIHSGQTLDKSGNSNVALDRKQDEVEADATPCGSQFPHSSQRHHGSVPDSASSESPKCLLEYNACLQAPRQPVTKEGTRSVVGDTNVIISNYLSRLYHTVRELQNALEFSGNEDEKMIIKMYLEFLLAHQDGLTRMSLHILSKYREIFSKQSVQSAHQMNESSPAFSCSAGSSKPASKKVTENKLMNSDVVDVLSQMPCDSTEDLIASYQGDTKREIPLHNCSTAKSSKQNSSLVSCIAKTDVSPGKSTALQGSGGVVSSSCHGTGLMRNGGVCQKKPHLVSPSSYLPEHSRKYAADHTVLLPQTAELSKHCSRMGKTGSKHSQIQKQQQGFSNKEPDVVTRKLFAHDGSDSNEEMEKQSKMDSTSEAEGDLSDQVCHERCDTPPQSPGSGYHVKVDSPPLSPVSDSPPSSKTAHSPSHSTWSMDRLSPGCHLSSTASPYPSVSIDQHGILDDSHQLASVSIEKTCKQPMEIPLSHDDVGHHSEDRLGNAANAKADRTETRDVVSSSLMGLHNRSPRKEKQLSDLTRETQPNLGSQNSPRLPRKRIKFDLEAVPSKFRSEGPVRNTAEGDNVSQRHRSPPKISEWAPLSVKRKFKEQFKVQEKRFKNPRIHTYHCAEEAEFSTNVNGTGTSDLKKGQQQDTKLSSEPSANVLHMHDKTMSHTRDRMQGLEFESDYIYPKVVLQKNTEVVPRSHWLTLDSTLLKMYSQYQVLHSKWKELQGSCSMENSEEQYEVGIHTARLHVYIESTVAFLETCHFESTLLSWPQEVLLPEKEEEPLHRPLSSWQKEHLIKVWFLFCILSLHSHQCWYFIATFYSQFLLVMPGGLLSIYLCAAQHKLLFCWTIPCPLASFVAFSGGQ